MRRLSSGILWAALLIGLGCPAPQRSFAVVSPEEAQVLLRKGGLSVVEAASTDSPGAGKALEATPGQETKRPAPPPEAPRGGVLVIASTAPAGYRTAAALSRSGNRPTYVCISANAEERSRLYALALQTREFVRDGDY
jgi:hypothetical protein